MKKILLTLSVFISSFFLFSKITLADTSFTFSDYYINFDTEYPIFLQNKETILNTLNTYPYWEQAYQSIANIPNSYSFGVYDCSSSGSYNFSSSGLTYGRCYVYSYSNDYTSVSYTIRTNLNLVTPTVYSTYYGYFYSNYDFIAYLTNSGYNSIIIPTYTSTTYNKTIPEIVLHNGDKIPTYDDIYNTYINPPTPPTPPDNYPLLTSFYNLFIEKIYFLCEYIYSDYILLSVLVVLLLYISILFFRRLK